MYDFQDSTEILWWSLVYMYFAIWSQGPTICKIEFKEVILKIYLMQLFDTKIVRYPFLELIQWEN